MCCLNRYRLVVEDRYKHYSLLEEYFFETLPEAVVKIREVVLKEIRQCQKHWTGCLACGWCCSLHEDWRFLKESCDKKNSQRPKNLSQCRNWGVSNLCLTLTKITDGTKKLRHSPDSFSYDLTRKVIDKEEEKIWRFPGGCNLKQLAKKIDNP